MMAQRIPMTTPVQSNTVEVEQVSLANPYVGAVKLAYNLDDNQSLEDNVIFSGALQLTPIKGDRYAVPIVGAIGLGSSDLLNPASGLNIGVYPYYILSENEDITLILHGGVNYKVLVEDTDADLDPPQQIKALIGIEAVFGQAGKLPFTLSVNPAYLYNTNGSMDDTAVLEVSGVVPFAPKLAILAELAYPFEKGISSQLRLGVLTVF
jgi:hypothetical protein